VSTTLSSIIAFVVGGVVTLAMTPVAIRIAARTGFYDQPVGYKQHGRPTPYLGGVAVLGGFLVAAVASGILDARHLPILGVAIGAWVLGTLDDRRGLGPGVRVLAEVGLATALWGADLGWHLVASDALNLLATIVWLVAIVNAFNLMDNMDGTCSTTAAIALVGLGIFALSSGGDVRGVLALAMAGACTGFLRANLARPARIFLGDGGSVTIGVLVAASAMSVDGTSRLGFGAVVCAILLAGLPVLDTVMVIISRRRRGVPILTGGRDHLTHRLLPLLGSARRVCVALAGAGIVLDVTALVAQSTGKTPVLWTGTAAAAAAICVIVGLELMLDARPAVSSLARDPG
jgi:UDP-GlcNAc:undecaprenyl-phosphate GlcNAc-1-phosphate transferase